MSEVAVATVSVEAAEAGARVADAGGNAVDAALAAGLVAVVTHPGMCSLGGGGFITVWPASGEPETVDGGMEMPGRGLPVRRFGHGRTIRMGYAGGVQTVVGPGSVATPGLLAACSLAADRHGRLPWRELVEPARRQVEDGFPMPSSSHAYLVHAHEPIYARDPRSRAALQDDDGRLLEPGETVRVEHLSDTLEALAEEGAEVLYRGELGRKVVEHLQDHGGILTRLDLAEYRAVVRRPLEGSLDEWRVVTNPPPSLGGAVVVAMLALAGARPRRGWTARDVAWLVRVQEAVLRWRRARLDTARDPEAEVKRLLAAARSGDPARMLEELEEMREEAEETSPRRGSASTLHVSAVDSEGTGCAATFSDGYGSGVMPPGTGLWLNNCLGETELNPRGFHRLEPGTRLLSNMSPTVARGASGAVLALGSPGGERIPTAVTQALLNRVRLGMRLEEAVQHPRLHAEPLPEGILVTCEPDLPLEGLESGDGGDVTVRRFPEPSMFFGGVAAAQWHPDEGFQLGADPRRTGGTAVGGGR